jgi:heat shock protein HtpX
MTRFLNNVKTAALLGGLFGLILFIGARFGPGGLLIAFLFGGIGNLVAFFYSDKIAVAAMGGQEVDEDSAPQLVALVRRLATRAELPMPKVYLCPQEAPNAFATGRNPENAAVAVTKGALNMLSEEELAGVVGHELAHIKNRDTLISTVAATIAGALNTLAWFGIFFLGDEENPLAGLLVLLVAPFAAMIIQMALSRSREYVADADGARIAGGSAGLISALQTLEAGAQQAPLHNGRHDEVNQLCIVEPLTGGRLANLFSTHPPMDDRIAKLREVELA